MHYFSYYLVIYIIYIYMVISLCSPEFSWESLLLWVRRRRENECCPISPEDTSSATLTLYQMKVYHLYVTALWHQGCHTIIIPPGSSVAYAVCLCRRQCPHSDLRSDAAEHRPSWPREYEQSHWMMIIICEEGLFHSGLGEMWSKHCKYVALFKASCLSVLLRTWGRGCHVCSS